jgi:hypothetical protein
MCVINTNNTNYGVNRSHHSASEKTIDIIGCAIQHQLTNDDYVINVINCYLFIKCESIVGM